jgi:hypothetical protein
MEMNMSDGLKSAMDEIAGINEKGKKGTVNLKGKTYTNVSARVEVFRKHLGLEYGLDTEVLFPQKGVMMIAKIRDKGGFVVGSGHAYASDLAKDKSLEKLESVSVGRAMASIGLSGGEYASDSEIESWPDRYEPKAGETKTVNSGIHITPSADDVDPESFINSKIERMYQYIEKPKSTLQKLAEADVKTRQDPIFKKIVSEGLNDIRDNYEVAIADCNTKLKQRLEKETA